MGTGHTFKILGLLGRILVRPRLLPLLLRSAWRFRARGWYRRPPFLPVPPAAYLDWRFHTAYGDSGVGPTTSELRRYLEWVLWMRRSRPGG